MQIQLGAIAANARGSLGGVTASRNRGGAYLRNRTTPTNPVSARRTAVRQAFGDLAQAWSQTLDQSQREAWNVYAAGTPALNKVGESFFPSGFNRFMAGNSLWIDAGGTLIEDAPVAPGDGPAAAMTYGDFVYAAGDVTVATPDWTYAAATDRAFVSVGLPMTAETNVYYGPYVLAVAGLVSALESAMVFPVAGGAVGQFRSWRVQVVTPEGKVGQEFKFNQPLTSGA